MKIIESPKVRAELAFASHDVKRFQEWLWLHGLKVEIDGVLGPATRAALVEFRKRHELECLGLDESVVAALTLPMRRALEVLAGGPQPPIREAILRVAQMHLAAGACEAPGKNRGPWVRLYGEEGKPWCAGFVSFVLAQAAEATGQPVPIPGSLSCDQLAAEAARRERLTETVEPGDAFLIWKPIPGGHKDYCHTGFVEKVAPDHLVTIEGNTNPSGGREGYEVERRIRSFDRKDFIRLG
jgi:hypothetical protein